MKEKENYKKVPLMFQAQVPGRCQLQRVPSKKSKQKNRGQNNSDRPAYDEWKKQWIESVSGSKDGNHLVYQDKEPEESSSVMAQAFARVQEKIIVPEAHSLEREHLGNEVRTREYRISWRMVSNCGQDQGLIRPIIGAKGYPHFPGSSMKGAFRRACDSPEEILKYCGGEIILENGETRTKPGILRFHGADPTDATWTQNLVDVIHSQQNKQVKGENENGQPERILTKDTQQVSAAKTTKRSPVSPAIASPASRTSSKPNTPGLKRPNPPPSGLKRPNPPPPDLQSNRPGKSGSKKQTPAAEKPKSNQKKGDSTSANAMISLHRVTLEFGISSTLKLTESEWDRVWEIWEKALAKGLGSRTSAGYGRFEKAGENRKDYSPILPGSSLLKVSLSGTGIASQLLDKTAELRPNMFKAALRGHTLRLFGGMTDAAGAEYLTKLLWGGLREKGNREPRASWDKKDNDKKDNGAIAGLLGIAFDCKTKNPIKEQKYDKDRAPIATYDLKGTLHIFSTYPKEPVPAATLQRVAKALIQFAMLFGGFGKSWRRIDHQKFFRHYTNSKPTIGCHWEFESESKSLYLADPPSNIASFIREVQKALREFARAAGVTLKAEGVANWRESWHPYKKGIGGVEVWGRKADGDKGDRSLGVTLLHDTRFKGTTLTGFIGSKGKNEGEDKGSQIGSKGGKDKKLDQGEDKGSQTGRIWHRMYPERDGSGHTELFVIFPDEKPDEEVTKQFIENLQEFEFNRIFPV